MNLKEALNYIHENHEKMIESGKSILGVAYTPDESEADFYIVELSLSDEGEFSISLAGGYINSFSGVEDSFWENNIDELLNIIPDFVKEIKYSISENGDCMYDITEYALKKIFPELPDPDDLGYTVNRNDFKSQAIVLINQTNNN